MFLIRPLDGTSERELQIDKLKLLRIEKKGKCVERRGNKTVTRDLHAQEGSRRDTLYVVC